MSNIRIKNFKFILKNQKIDGYISTDINEAFYLFSLSVSKIEMMFFSNKIFLFLDGRYLQMAKEKNKDKDVLVKDKDEKIDVLKKFFNKNKNIKSLGFNSKKVTYYDFIKNTEFFKKELRLKINHIPLDESPCMWLRLIKDASEIKAMIKAARITYQGVLYAQKCLKEGISEKELALKIECFCRQKGADKMSFDTIVAFGKNTAYPHHKTSNSKLKKNDFVLIDMGARVDNYDSDLTRFFFFGNVNKKVFSLYKLVRDAQNIAKNLCKPGKDVKEIDKVVRDFFKKNKVEQYFSHSLGHGVGIDIHEPPRLQYNANEDIILKENMVITLEPGLYIPGTGGVRYEDMILITKKGYKNFYLDEELNNLND